MSYWREIRETEATIARIDEVLIKLQYPFAGIGSFEPPPAAKRHDSLRDAPEKLEGDGLGRPTEGEDKIG